jgi:hypothetical protein
MVERLRDQPFALLGVNVGGLEDAIRASTRLKMTWRSFHDGYDGSIATEWGVERWPTVIVIDAKGVVRYRFLGAVPDAIENAVQTLMREL